MHYQPQRLPGKPQSFTVEIREGNWAFFGMGYSQKSKYLNTWNVTKHALSLLVPHWGSSVVILCSLLTHIFSTVKVKVTQSCPTLCDPMDYTVCGILQARILEWVAFPFSGGSSQPRFPTLHFVVFCGFFTSWATHVKNLPAVLEMGSIPGSENPLEEGMATHSSILAWRIPWTEEPGGLLSMALQSQTQLNN